MSTSSAGEAGKGGTQGEAGAKSAPSEATPAVSKDKAAAPAAAAESAPPPPESPPKEPPKPRLKAVDPDLGLMPEYEVEPIEPVGTDGFEDYDTDGGPPARDAQGRFVKRGEGGTEAAPPEGQDVGGEVPPEGESATAEGESTPADGAAFTFGGETFKSKTDAEQNFRSLRGQFKPMQARIAELERVVDEAKVVNDRWVDWAKAQESAASDQHPRGTTGDGPGPARAESKAAAGDAIEGIINGVDWDGVERLMEREGGVNALKYTLKAALSKMAGVVDAKLSERTQGFERYMAGLSANQLTVRTFEEAAAQKRNDGAPLYPELQHDKGIVEIHNIWKQLGLPEQVAFSQKGVLMAYAIHRLIYGDSKGSGSTATTDALGEGGGGNGSEMAKALKGAAAAVEDVLPGTSRSVQVPHRRPGPRTGGEVAQDILRAGRGHKPYEEFGLAP